MRFLAAQRAHSGHGRAQRRQKTLAEAQGTRTLVGRTHRLGRRLLRRALLLKLVLGSGHLAVLRVRRRESNDKQHTYTNKLCLPARQSCRPSRQAQNDAAATR